MSASVICRYEIMCLCWKENPLMRPTFADITKRFPDYLQTYKVHILFFFLSLLISYWTFVSANHWFSMHRPLPFSREQRHYLAPGLGRQNAVICMKLSTQVSTSVLSRGPTRKERGEVLLPYYFLKGRDNEGRTLSDTRRALKTQENSGTDINNWP